MQDTGRAPGRPGPEWAPPGGTPPPSPPPPLSLPSGGSALRPSSSPLPPPLGAAQSLAASALRSSGGDGAVASDAPFSSLNASLLRGHDLATGGASVAGGRLGVGGALEFGGYSGSGVRSTYARSVAPSVAGGRVPSQLRGEFAESDALVSNDGGKRGRGASGTSVAWGRAGTNGEIGGGNSQAGRGGGGGREEGDDNEGDDENDSDGFPARLAPWRGDLDRWLRSHGKTVRPRLSRLDARILPLCFRLMDLDGSGAIDADELAVALKTLGLVRSRSQVEALLRSVDRDGTEEIELDEFLEMMAAGLAGGGLNSATKPAKDHEKRRKKRLEEEKKRRAKLERAKAEGGPGRGSEKVAKGQVPDEEASKGPSPKSHDRDADGSDSHVPASSSSEASSDGLPSLPPSLALPQPATRLPLRLLALRYARLRALEALEAGRYDEAGNICQLVRERGEADGENAAGKDGEADAHWELESQLAGGSKWDAESRFNGAGGSRWDVESRYSGVRAGPRPPGAEVESGTGGRPRDAAKWGSSVVGGSPLLGGPPDLAISPAGHDARRAAKRGFRADRSVRWSPPPHLPASTVAEIVGTEPPGGTGEPNRLGRGGPVASLEGAAANGSNPLASDAPARDVSAAARGRDRAAFAVAALALRWKAEWQRAEISAMQDGPGKQTRTAA